MNDSLHIVLIGSPVGPLQQGNTGGVCNAIISTYRALESLGHRVLVLAPIGSDLVEIEGLVCVAGQYAKPLQNHQDEVVDQCEEGTFLKNTLDRLRGDSSWDVAINFANDLLPYSVGKKFENRPLLQMPNMANVNPQITAAMQSFETLFPDRIACLTKAQAHDLGLPESVRVFPGGLDLNDYDGISEIQGKTLAYFGRVSPEKGIDQAARVARLMGRKLKVMGAIDDSSYFEQLQSEFADVVDYRGYLSRCELRQELADCSCVLHLHSCKEAFGRVFMESAAWGLPVVASDRGGAKEVVVSGKTGYLVDREDLATVTDAILKAESLDRPAMRAIVEERYSLKKLAQNFADWLEDLNLDKAN